MLHLISANSIKSVRACVNLTLSYSHDAEEELLLVQEKLVAAHVEGAEIWRFGGSRGNGAARFEAQMHVTQR